jgi:hypothetical protein
MIVTVADVDRVIRARGFKPLSRRQALPEKLYKEYRVVESRRNLPLGVVPAEGHWFWIGPWQRTPWRGYDHRPYSQNKRPATEREALATGRVSVWRKVGAEKWLRGKLMGIDGPGLWNVVYSERLYPKCGVPWCVNPEHQTKVSPAKAPTVPQPIPSGFVEHSVKGGTYVVALEHGDVRDHWLWTGHYRNGYPYVNHGGRNRVGSAPLAVKLAEDAQFALHYTPGDVRLRRRCGDRRCVRPEHQEEQWVGETRAERIARAERAAWAEERRRKGPGDIKSIHPGGGAQGA